GFVFDAFNADAYRRALRRAFALWSQQACWARVRTSAMRQQFGWNAAAARYVGIYAGFLEG
ncbi:starch synthase, partial [Pelomonas sp. HMWF004]